MKPFKPTVSEIDSLLNRVEMDLLFNTEWWDAANMDKKVDHEKIENVSKTDRYLDKLWGALWLLRQYRAIGVEPEEVAELVSRNTTKLPEKVDAQPYFRKHFQPHVCPNCRHRVYDPDIFCSKCGQRLK